MELRVTRHPLERPNRTMFVDEASEVELTGLDEFGIDIRVKKVLEDSFGIAEIFPSQRMG